MITETDTTDVIAQVVEESRNLRIQIHVLTGYLRTSESNNARLARDKHVLSLRIRSVLESLRRPHLYIEEDDYYSCSKSINENGQSPRVAPARDDVCTCGADRDNAIIDEALKMIL